MHRRYIDIKDSDTLALATDDIGAPGPGEVLIRVDYAGLNRADVLQRLGLYPVPEDASPIMGLEVAGTIAATGPGVTRFSEGQRVCALVHGGGYASAAIAREDHCLVIPENVDTQTAAALPEALLTVWHNVFTLGGLKEGGTTLIHGGSSGIGSMAVQMAKARGATVVATAGGDKKCTAVARLGADRVVDYRDDDLLTTLKDAGYAGKIDVILDLAGGDFAQTNLELAAPDGRIVCIGVMRGAKAEINLFTIMAKRLTLTGSTLRGMDMATRAAGFAAIEREIMPLIADGRIAPLIETIYPLEQAMAAQQLMQSGHHMGKILLDCRTGEQPQ